MRLADLSRAAAMPSAKAHRYLVSLARAGLVEQDAETARYDLGPLMLRAGLAALGRSDALKRAERALEAIAARTGETAAAAVWGTHGPTHVRLVEARHELAATVPPGHVCPMTYSAAGLVFCAFGDPHLTAPLAEREMAQSRAVGRPGAPTSAAELERLVEAVRAQGFASGRQRGGRRAGSRLGAGVRRRRRAAAPRPDGVRPRRAAQHRAGRAGGGADGGGRAVARGRVARPAGGGRPTLTHGPELPRLCRGHRWVVRVACRRHEASDARRPRRGLRGRACPGSPGAAQFVLRGAGRPARGRTALAGLWGFRLSAGRPPQRRRRRRPATLRGRDRQAPGSGIRAACRRCCR